MLNFATVNEAIRALNRAHLVLNVQPYKGIHYQLKDYVADMAHVVMDDGDMTPWMLFDVLRRNATASVVVLDTGLIFRDSRGRYREQFADLIMGAMMGKVSMMVAEREESFEFKAKLVVTSYCASAMPADMLRRATVATSGAKATK